MVEAANNGGYAKANVSEVITAAGVSRPTFYQYFDNKDDCFRVAVEEASTALLTHVRRAIGEAEANEALVATARGLINFATDEPPLARFLFNEPLGGNSAALDARDEGLRTLERSVQTRLRHADPTASAPDYPARPIIGGLCRLVGGRLRRAEPRITALIADLEAWLDAYQRPYSEHQWRQRKPNGRPTRSPFVPKEPLSAPPPFRRGRSRLDDEEIADRQRLRLLFAAAELAQQRGYNAATVEDITKRAGIDARVFYAMFADKQGAFMAVHEFGAQRVMEVTAEAFFSGDTWPERNWEAGRAFTQFLDTNPLVANVGFVEAYAVGPAAIQRVEDSHAAFGMLMQEGFHVASPGHRPPKLATEIIVKTIFETVYGRVRAPGTGRLAALLPHFTFLVLAPFVGPNDADDFIAGKLAPGDA
jgi:AcrR family transcriptional regulator